MITSFKKVLACSTIVLAFSIPAAGANAHSVANHSGITQTLQNYNLTNQVNVSNWKITHTKRGAIIEGKLSNTSKRTQVTLRIADRELTGRTANYEWEYTDRSGNFRIVLADFYNDKDRHWQLELGGSKAYYKYGDILAEGVVKSGQTASSSSSEVTPEPPVVPPVTPPPVVEPPVVTPPVEEPNTGVNPSNGEGGVFTDRTFINYSAAGKTGQYHIYASGIDTTKPVGVTFQFHGDGGYEFKNPSYKLPGLNKEAKDHNMIFVSMKAPNSQNVWWSDLEKNGDYARSLIQNEILGKYNIDKNKVWAVGYSGGAEFISYELIQEHSDLFTGGGAILFGGGGAPTWFERTPTAEFKNDFQMLWYTGLDDDLGNSDAGWSAIADATKGYNFYKSAGFKKASMVTPAGIDHFEYDEPKVFGDALDARY